MKRLWIAFLIWMLDFDIAQGEEAMQMLIKDLPQMRRKRKALCERLYAVQQDQPA